MRTISSQQHLDSFSTKWEKVCVHGVGRIASHKWCSNPKKGARVLHGACQFHMPSSTFTQLISPGHQNSSGIHPLPLLPVLLPWSWPGQLQQLCNWPLATPNSDFPHFTLESLKCKSELSQYPNKSPQCLCVVCLLHLVMQPHPRTQALVLVSVFWKDQPVLPVQTCLSQSCLSI